MLRIQVCPMCRTKNEMEVDSKKFEEYYQKKALIQDVFPELNPVEREFIKSGYCVSCQKKLFGNKYTSNKIKEVVL